MRIRILRDDDCHTYFVPVGLEAAFEAYLESVENDELPIPEGVIRVGRHLSCYTFADPEEDD